MGSWKVGCVMNDINYHGDVFCVSTRLTSRTHLISSHFIMFCNSRRQRNGLLLQQNKGFNVNKSWVLHRQRHEMHRNLIVNGYNRKWLTVQYMTKEQLENYKHRILTVTSSGTIEEVMYFTTNWQCSKHYTQIHVVAVFFPVREKDM